MRRLLRHVVLLPIRIGDAYAAMVARRWPGVSAEWNDRAYHRVRGLSASVHYESPAGAISLVLRTPNEVCRYRADTFATKEPETLEWIDKFGGEGALYDVGANVGLYSLYYAKTHPGRVYAFEPSALNLGLLATHVSDNDLSTRIVIVPTPLTERNEVAAFHLSMLDEGGAMSTFGQNYGHDGKSLDSQLEYETIGMSLDSMISSGLLVEPPSMLKIDVDGIEHLILRGARKSLLSPELKTVLIEVNDNFAELADEVALIMKSAGFVLGERRHSSMFEGGEFQDTFNQIWVREPVHIDR